MFKSRRPDHFFSLPMKTYVFRVVVEPDDDRWFAYAPALESLGGATWGHTREEALKNLREVLQMTVEGLRAHGQAIPEQPLEDVQVFDDSQVAVSL